MAHQVFLMIYFPEFNEYLFKKKNNYFAIQINRENKTFFLLYLNP